MRGIVFVAMLLLTGFGSLCGGIGLLYDRIHWQMNGRSAVMVLADPEHKPRGLVLGGYDVFLIDVKYVGKDGEVTVPQKHMSLDMAKRLSDGEQIPLRYLKSDPQRTMFAGQDTDSPWIWLVLGPTLLAVGLFARKLLSPEAHQRL